MTTLEDPRVRVVLLDIEGTTTPSDFVSQTLFPYARRHLEQFLHKHLGDPAVRANLEQLRAEHAEDMAEGLDPPSLESTTAVEALVRYVHWLMDRDRKSTGLKSLQGKIWEAGYRSGELRGEVYDDVPRALERWRSRGRDIAIFSSGSVLAQRLLFSSTQLGDLTPAIRTFFDTTAGPKREPRSYLFIATALGLSAPEILFISDVTAEIDAAQAAGMQAVLCLRPGQPAPDTAALPVIRTFDEVFP